MMRLLLFGCIGVLLSFSATAQQDLQKEQTTSWLPAIALTKRTAIAVKFLITVTFTDIFMHWQSLPMNHALIWLFRLQNQNLQKRAPRPRTNSFAAATIQVLGHFIAQGRIQPPTVAMEADAEDRMLRRPTSMLCGVKQTCQMICRTASILLSTSC